MAELRVVDRQQSEHVVRVRPYVKVDTTGRVSTPLVEGRLEVACSCGWAHDMGAGDVALVHLEAIAIVHIGRLDVVRRVGGSDVA